jgi:hypothetical protein
MGRGSNRSRVDGNEDIKHGIGVEGVGYNGVCLLLVDELKCSNVANVFTSHHVSQDSNASRDLHSTSLVHSIHSFSPTPSIHPPIHICSLKIPLK